MGYTVELTWLGCKRDRGFDPYALRWLFEQRRWHDRMAAVPKRFRCTVCFVQTAASCDRVRITNNAPTDDARATDREWKGR